MSIGAIASSYAPAGGGFDPLSISWLDVFWAADPSWSNPGDGNAVSSWRNAGSSAADATQGTGGNRPTFRSSYANLSNQPAVEFDGTDDYLVNSRSAASQPNHIYIVGYTDASGDSIQTQVDGLTGFRHLVRLRSGSTMEIFAGANAFPGTAISGAFQVAVLFDSSASALRCNGQSFTSLSVGANTSGATRIGSDRTGSNRHKGGIAFVGLKDTALTSDELNDLDAWAQSTYGVPAL